MSKKYYACVYGGASEKIDEKHRNKIYKLGKIIADNDFSLVYGAGASGCMGAVANGVKKNGGDVLGVSPNFIREFEQIFMCDNTLIVDTMSERKVIMEKYADIFIIAPGGIGTLDEFFQIITLKYLKQLSTPIIILNLNGFYDSLLVLIDDLVNQGAVTYDVYPLFDVITSVDDDKLSNYFNKIKKLT